MQFVDLDTFPVDRAAVGRLTGAVCRRYTVLPIAFEGDAIVLAMADPTDVLALDVDIHEAGQLALRIDALAKSGKAARQVVKQVPHRLAACLDAHCALRLCAKRGRDADRAHLPPQKST